MNMKFTTLADMLVAAGDEFRTKELMEEVGQLVKDGNALTTDTTTGY